MYNKSTAKAYEGDDMKIVEMRVNQAENPMGFCMDPICMVLPFLVFRLSTYVPLYTDTSRMAYLSRLSNTV